MENDMEGYYNLGKPFMLKRMQGRYRYSYEIFI